MDTVDAGYRAPGQPGHGLVIVSTRFKTDCKEEEMPSVDLVSWSTWYEQGVSGAFPVTGPADRRDFQNPPGYLIVRELRANPHEFRYFDINDVRMQLRGGIPFKVEEGKAVYLGELQMSYTNCNTHPAVGLAVKDAWERDLRLLLTKMPNLRPEDVIKQVLPSSPPSQR
ncbi:hypothetical protein ACLESO_55260 [Pyxidicoccus sp. 3LG]